MFFVLRMIFWLGLVLVLLPRDKTPESDKAPQIGAAEAVQVVHLDEHAGEQEVIA